MVLGGEGLGCDGAAGETRVRVARFVVRVLRSEGFGEEKEGGGGGHRSMWW